MSCRSFGRKVVVRAVCGAALLVASISAMAQQESVLYSFNPTIKQGVNPQSNVTFDSAGNLYGTTYSGGVYSCFGLPGYCGTVFELSPTGDGGWTEKTLHNFGRDNDGSNPSAGVIFDSAGNLYGTTSMGGAYGYGIVFELSPTESGGWAERVLHHFNYNGADGMYPYAGLIFDAEGNLYGTTGNGGTFDAGTVFELSPADDGTWTETILHSFVENGREGVSPWSSLIADSSGNFYSTTSGGGVYGFGTVFEFSKTADGSWTVTTLHNFNYNGEDAVQPYTGLAFDQHGNLYGATTGGGVYNYGAVYELSPAANGNWTEKILHSFENNGKDGTRPTAGATLDALGNVYGTTSSGGAYAEGTVYELSGGDWTETILYSFKGLDGDQPEGTVTLDSAGNIYGTTNFGGPYGKFGFGTVFEIKP